MAKENRFLKADHKIASNNGNEFLSRSASLPLVNFHILQQIWLFLNASDCGILESKPHERKGRWPLKLMGHYDQN